VTNSGVRAIHAGRLVDVVAGNILADQTVVVQDGRVVRVQPRADPLPDGADELDLSSCTVIPGLIDLHTHLVGPVEAGDPLSILQRSAAVEALTGVANAAATLRAGFTTVRDVGSFRAFVDVALRDAIDAGVVPGPRMRCAGAYITCTSGGGEVTGATPDVTLPAELRVGVADSVDDVLRAVRRILAGGADLIKVIATGAVLAPGTDPGAPELREDQIRAAVEIATDHGAFVAAHAHGAEGAKRATRAGVRSIEHGSLLDEEALDLLGEHGTWLVADVYNGTWIAEVGEREQWPRETLRKNADTTDAQRAVFTEAVRRGLNVAFGTDSGVYPHGLNARQLPVMVGLGMTPVGALRAATWDAARCLGWDDEVGSLQPGRYADLVAVQGHELGTLEVLQHPVAVLKSGVNCLT
jgi:imidazolonepropionase-like amidohydrolase